MQPAWPRPLASLSSSRLTWPFVTFPVEANRSENASITRGGRREGHEGGDARLPSLPARVRFGVSASASAAGVAGARRSAPDGGRDAHPTGQPPKVRVPAERPLRTKQGGAGELGL